MTFEEAMKAYWQLRARYEANQIPADALENAVQSLQVRDEYGQTWQIAARSGNWYRLENGIWVEDFPPPNLVEPVPAPPTAPATSRPTPRKKNGCVTIFIAGIIIVCLLAACVLLWRLANALQYMW